MTEFLVKRVGANDLRPEFDCGDVDLNEFFQKDSIKSCLELLSVTYIVEQDGELAAFFSISNDAITKESCPKSAFRRATKDIPREKRYSSLPAVKIGRLGISSAKQSQGVGSEILRFMKGWFTEGNKTGCRFIIVDAYNNKHAISFYEKNGFSFLSSMDDEATTRLMYFDLRLLRR